MSRIHALYMSIILVWAMVANAHAANFQSLPSIQRAAEAHAHKLAQEGRWLDVQVSSRQLDSRLHLVQCGQALETFSPASSGVGRTTVGVRCSSPKSWTLYVPVQVKANINTVVVKTAMARGTVLSANNLTVRRQSIATVRGNYLSRVSSAVGKELRRSVKAGSVLSLNMLTTPETVKRGQLTELLVSLGSVQVTMQGTALSGGAAGETIRVRNLTSGKTVEGVIAANGQVLIP